MYLKSAFFAYPASPSAVGQAIDIAAANVRARTGTAEFVTWKHIDICGHFIANQVLGAIDSAAVLIADITRLNFNVIYEIGYAIGRGKPVFIVKNSALAVEDIELAELGIFDTLGFQSYQNSEQLTAVLLRDQDVAAIEIPIGLNSRQPLYMVEPKFKTELISRLNSRINKTKMLPRRFDPNEQARMAAFDAIQKVAESHGVIIPLLAPEVQGARIHNLRAAFVAGLSEGMEKVHLVIQEGASPVPIDYRDLATSCFSIPDIDDAVADFAASLMERITSQNEVIRKAPENFLQSIDIGGSTAENELRDLGSYYLETEQYERVSRGEIRVVVGRKGSGKTAIFFRARDRARRNKQHLVLDLKPEGYQLRKFRDSVVALLQQGSQEHLVMAFWEYVLYLEICAKIIEADAERHIRDSRIYQPYRELVEHYGADELVIEGDFSDRVESLSNSIAERFAAKFESLGNTALSNSEVTDLLYRHDLAGLKDLLLGYLTSKEEVWIFFDNIDKGWPSQGVAPTDIIILRTLLEATRKIERDMTKRGIVAHITTFIRNDVYEILLENTPDRGKEPRTNVDWTDADQLREVLRLRLSRHAEEHIEFSDVWSMVCVPLVAGEDSAQYLIDRCLMRPRALIDLFNHCRSFAVTLHHPKIDEGDIKKGVDAFSNDLVSEINLEIRDVIPEAEDLLYHFIGGAKNISLDNFISLMEREGRNSDTVPRLLDVLIWHGVLGLIWPDGRVEYIFDVKYNLRLFKAQMEKLKPAGLMFQINPVFWPALLGE